MASNPQICEGIDVCNPQPFKAEIEEIANSPLPAELDWWIQQYSSVGCRDEFIWKWCLKGIEVTSLPCVDPGIRDFNNQTKLLGIMFVVLLDDVADHAKNKRFLEKLIDQLTTGRQCELSSLSMEQRHYAHFTFLVWDEILNRARNYPRYEEFKDLLNFDYLQIFNVIRYSYLINSQPNAINMVEHDLYSPHNMHMMCHGTLDIMCSPEFDSDELGVLRSILWYGECMGRVGNLTTTWEREVTQRDFSSGVFALALDEQYLQPNELYSFKPETLTQRIRQNRCEEYFLMRWYQYRERICELADKVNSLDVTDYVKGLDNLFRNHLGSRGMK